MYRFIFPVSVMLIFSFSLAAQTAANGAGAIVAETVKDLGNHYDGEKVNFSFLFKNNGKFPVMLKDLKPSCGCIVSKADVLIGVGESGRVYGEMDLSSLKGVVSKTILVHTSDSTNPKFELTLKVNVLSAFSVSPGYARFTSVQGEADSKGIPQLISASDKAAFDITGIENSMSFIKTSYREALEAERLPGSTGKQWVLQIALASDAPVGPLANYVTVKTNHPKQKSLRIPVSGFVRPQVVVSSSSLDFGEKKNEGVNRKDFKLIVYSAQNIAVTKVTCDHKDIEVVWDTREEGKNYEMRAWLKPSMPKGPFSSKIIIHTNSKEYPVLEIPVKGTVL